MNAPPTTLSVAVRGVPHFELRATIFLTRLGLSRTTPRRRAILSWSMTTRASSITRRVVEWREVGDRETPRFPGSVVAVGKPGRKMSDALTSRTAQEWRAERDAEERLRHRQPGLSSLAALASTPAPELLPLVPPTPPLRPYPVAALGRVLSGAAASIAAKCQCAPALAAQSVLAVASLASQRLADVRLPYRQTRPLSLFLVTVAASGDRKTTADNEALIPVRMHEKNLKESYQAAYESWRISHSAWVAEQRKIENDKNLDRPGREATLSALGKAPIEPNKPLLTAPEPTVEALAKHWPVLPAALGLFSAEGGQMTGGHGFGPDHRLKTAAALSSLWDGAGIRARPPR